MCVVCKRSVNSRYDDVLICVQCDSRVHIKCVNVSFEDYSEMNRKDELKSWKCKSCPLTSLSRDETATKGNSNFPIHQMSSESLGDLAEDGGDYSVKCVLDSIMHKIETLVYDVKAACGCEKVLKDLKRENSALKKTVESQSVIIQSLRDDFGEKINELKGVMLHKAGEIGTNNAGSASKGKQVIHPEQELLVNTDVENESCKDHDGSTGATAGSEMPPLSGSSCATRKNVAVPMRVIYRSGENHVPAEDGAAAFAGGSARSGNAVDAVDETWTKVARKRTRGRRPLKDAIIGQMNEEDSVIRAAPRKTYLHISRLHPETTSQQLEDQLRRSFPEVECEKLQSKYPSHYSSFKITIDMDKREMAMDPQLWPRGTLVNRYFFRRKGEVGVK